MNLVIHGTAPMRVLTGPDGFKPCQENRLTIVDGDMPDTQRFASLMANGAHTKTPWEETAEGIASALAGKEMEERDWRNSELLIFDGKINAKEDIAVNATAERAHRVVLRNYPQQAGFPNNSRPVFTE